MKAKGHKFEVIFFRKKRLFTIFNFFYPLIITYDFCLKKRIKFKKKIIVQMIRESERMIQIVLTFCMKDNIKISFLFRLFFKNKSKNIMTISLLLQN